MPYKSLDKGFSGPLLLLLLLLLILLLLTECVVDVIIVVVVELEPLRRLRLRRIVLQGLLRLRKHYLCCCYLSLLPLLFQLCSLLLQRRCLAMQAFIERVTQHCLPFNPL